MGICRFVQVYDSYSAPQHISENAEMSLPKRMLVRNVAWSSEMSHLEPGFFDRLKQGQRPRVLWVGCSDSRVPAETITHSDPGALFVHRNIANLFDPADDNVGSVLEYGVSVLQVEDIVVCGHYGCGGVLAALGPPAPALPRVSRRIAPLRALACRHEAELDALPAGAARGDRLAEINVRAQVAAIRSSEIIRGASRPPRVHGWIFGLRDGRIKVLEPGGADEAGAAAPAAAAAAT
jgi:carbonic anhydrase